MTNHRTSTAALQPPPERKLVRQYQNSITRLIGDGLTPADVANGLITWLHNPSISRKRLTREIKRAHPATSQ